MPTDIGYPNVKVQVNFVAALDANNNVVESWWSFAPDQAELRYTGSGNPSDQLAFKLNAFNIDGSALAGAVFTETDGIRIAWPWNDQPVRQSDDPTVCSMPVNNYNQSHNPAGPFKFVAKIQYNGTTYQSPDPDVVLESQG